MQIHFDRDGLPITLKEWESLQHDWNYRYIAKNIEIRSDLQLVILTVWTGRAHELDTEGRPLVYETTVEQNGNTVFSAEYATAEEAVDGHRAVCAQYKLTCDGVPPKKQFNELRIRR